MTTHTKQTNDLLSTLGRLHDYALSQRQRTETPQLRTYYGQIRFDVKFSVHNFDRFLRYLGLVFDELTWTHGFRINSTSCIQTVCQGFRAGTLPHITADTLDTFTAQDME